MSIKCVNLESGLRIENDGRCKSCCMMTGYFSKTKQQNYNVFTDSFDEIFKSKHRKKILKSLQNGEKHPACNYCWNEEKAGKVSKRIRDNRTFKNNLQDVIQIIDVSMGTQCNIKCRTCGPYNSSFWNEEWFDIYGKSDKNKFKEYLQKLNCSFDIDSNFWKDFENNLKNTLHIDFYGGEPFLVKKQWNMLKYAIDKGYSKNISVHYNTNGTIWNDEVFEILKKFKNINIDFSIDGVKEKLNYIRYPADWNMVYNNFLKVKNISKDYDQFNVSICNTVSILNVYYINEMYDTFSDYHDSIYLNLVFGPEYYCIQNIPVEIKNQITNRLKVSTNISWIKNIVDFMNNKPPDFQYWEQFLKTTKIHDDYRKQDFKKIFPEFYEIIDNNGYTI